MDKVMIYSSPTCIYCKKAKDFLDANNVEYELIDVSTEKGRKELSDLGFTAVPVLIINGKTIRGFNDALIKEALGI